MKKTYFFAFIAIFFSNVLFANPIDTTSWAYLDTTYVQQFNVGNYEKAAVTIEKAKKQHSKNLGWKAHSMLVA